MKAQIKYIGIGLFIGGLLFSIGERYTIPYIKTTDTTSAELNQANKEAASLKEELSKLEQQIQTLENNEDQPVAEESTDKSSETESDTQSEDEESTDGETISGTIYVYENISLYDIGKQAEDLKLVKNGRELELYLSKPEYARSVQKGQFDLTSNMSIEEMVNILTGN